MCDYWYLFQYNFQTSTSLTFNNYLSYNNLKNTRHLSLLLWQRTIVPFFSQTTLLLVHLIIFSSLRMLFPKPLLTKEVKAFVSFKIINIWVIMVNFYLLFCSLSFHFHLENYYSRTQILVLFVLLVIIQRYLGAYILSWWYVKLCQFSSRSTSI